jgi:transketolase
VAGGVTVFEALKAHSALKEKEVLVRVVDIFSVKPVDKENLIRHA